MQPSAIIELHKPLLNNLGMVLKPVFTKVRFYLQGTIQLEKSLCAHRQSICQTTKFNPKKLQEQQDTTYTEYFQLGEMESSLIHSNMK